MSLRFQADADLKHSIVSDTELLERAAQEGRILVSHDRRTMLAHFRVRLEAGKSSPGLFVVSQGAPIGAVVSVIVLTWAASELWEWRDQVHHLPSLTRHVFRR